ncbi:MAG: acylglycerol kinase family protein [Sphingomonadaceae bacterium]|nr:acylglycerol kinase family protein [Sphingomonadaceae bacterium]
MVAVALISNPRSTGNRALLPRIRTYCAGHSDIFHYEVERADQIGAALASVALVRPRIIAINGGDGTVQAALTELYGGKHFGSNIVPPVAVLPNGKTNLIALDLGASGDPVDALEAILTLARGGFDGHIVERELISLSHGGTNRPVLGMFLGGAGLADIILYCRNRLYPLGLPNGLAHVLAGILAILSLVPGLGWIAGGRAAPVTVSFERHGAIRGRFAVLIVTTLEKLLFNARPGDGDGVGQMKLLAVHANLKSVFGMLRIALTGGLGQREVSGLYFEKGDLIRIEGDRSSVILDGELFEATTGQPITLQATAPVPFLKLAA